MLLYSWKQIYASLDGSVQQEMLLYSWKRFYASSDESLQQEMLLRYWKQFYANMDRSVQQEMVLSSWNQINATNCWKELHFEFFPPNSEQECSKPFFCQYSDDSSQCTAKASLEKGSSWPPEAIPYCHSFRVAFYYPKVPNPHLGPGLEGRWGQSHSYHSIIKKGYVRIACVLVPLAGWIQRPLLMLQVRGLNPTPSENTTSSPQSLKAQRGAGHITASLNLVKEAG